MRSNDSENEFEERCEGQYSEFEDGAELILYPGRDRVPDVPDAVAGLYALSHAPVIGDITFYPPASFASIEPSGDIRGVDGESIVKIGHAGEFSLLLGWRSGAIHVFDPIYFNHGALTAVALVCGSLYEFVNDVALGPRYRELFGHVGPQSDPWWETSSWYSYLQELGWT
ncbi:hypothetical protein ACSVDM_16790 [Nocardia sp. JW2]|uniref:hypothetical protein n=1 Tax=Nocardia sp. JW2 TaxID=3450738 RepID=UPI003F423C45